MEMNNGDRGADGVSAKAVVEEAVPSQIETF
jgi:hypothetical protein